MTIRPNDHENIRRCTEQERLDVVRSNCLGERREVVLDASCTGLAVVGEGERPPSLNPHIAYVRVASARRALASAAARFHPRQPGTVVAVTRSGPDGTYRFADLTEGTYTLTAAAARLAAARAARAAAARST